MSESGNAEAGKTTEYFVNGERQETQDKKLTASTILEDAGFKPADDWILSRDEGGKKFASSDDVEIHKDERFTAKRRGPTPTS
jgi:hypothetical protein